jgi:hypothetical protein
MNKAMGPLVIERAWNAADGRESYQIAWTVEQLRRIGQAIEEGDRALLTMIEEAMRQALEAALNNATGASGPREGRT